MAQNSTPKPPSKLVVLHNEWVAAGSPKLSKKEGGELLSAYMRARQDRATAEEALAGALLRESEAVANIIRRRGKGRVRIAGDVYVPMVRGETVFLRREGGGDVTDLGG